MTSIAKPWTVDQAVNAAVFNSDVRSSELEKTPALAPRRKISSSPALVAAPASATALGRPSGPFNAALNMSW
jgi:hypothetical protein